MQSNIIDVASPAVAHSTMSLLHTSNSDAEKLQESSDVSLLDTGASTTERFNGNDDVQLLNSPTEVLPVPSVLTQKTAPPLGDIFLKLEDIKPSNMLIFCFTVKLKSYCYEFLTDTDDE